MIHRIDRVNPDVDDRVIKPNEARDAVNLRFGASTEDTNLSGGTLILGNTELSFLPPSGTNRVVGVYSDLEARCVYFALYNGDTNHGLYRISGNTNAVEAILSGSWLNFQNGDDYNVSITAIDGKLYWTDNVNPPRMVNIEKGVRTQADPNGEDVYPVPVQDWHYTQIKRPPGEALLVSPVLTLDERSATIQNKTQTETGLQYSYYYVYDNFEESRLAPYTALSWATENVVVEIPNTEWNNYASVSSLIRAIVLVIRNGNDGVWRELQYQRNENGVRRWTFSNVLTAIKNTVSTDIVDARFDSVPLQSVTNEIAQNRVNHGNYVLDYEYDTSLKVEAKIDYIWNAVRSDNDFYTGEIGSAPVINSIRNNFPSLQFNSFVPWGRYTIGVEFVDKYGRTYPVINSTEAIAPYINQAFQNAAGEYFQGLGDNPIQVPLNFSSGTNNNGNNVLVPRYEQGINRFEETPDTALNTIGLYKITGLSNGLLPDWVDRVNIVRSKAKNITTMIQSIGQIFLWYENEQQETKLFTMVWGKWYGYNGIPLLEGRTLDLQTIWSENQDQDNGRYTFKGYAIFHNNSEPFVNLGNQYVTIYPTYNPNGGVNPRPEYAPFDSNGEAGDVQSFLEIVKFPVYSINGGFIFIKSDSQILVHPRYENSIIRDFSLRLTPNSIPVAVFGPNVNTYAKARKSSNVYPLFYNFTLTQEQNVDDQAIYSTQRTYSKTEFEQEYNQSNGIIGYITGDGSICNVKKTYPNTSRTLNLYTLPSTNDERPVIDSAVISSRRVEWGGQFISMSPRDIYAQTWNQDIGQVNVTDYKDVRNRRLNSSICFSLPIVQGTQVNGLNKFNSLDSRLAPAENGPITALVTTNATQREPGVMLAIGTYGISSFYYNAIQLTNVDGSENVTTTDAYLASQRPLLGQYGCSRPMSVTKTPLGTVYWWSDVVNDLIRYTNAGLERLGLTFSFGNFLRRTYNDNPLLITWYDQVTDEIILSGQGTNPALPLRAAVFSERYKTFQGQREYFEREKEFLINYPERATGLPTKQYYFINGRIFVSDVEATGVDNNFLFGEYKNPALTIVTNEAPASVKQWNQIKVFGAKPTGVSLSCPSDSGSVPLVSSLSPQHFIERKGDYEAAIRRAENTTGGLLAGKIMESRIIYSTFAFDANTFVKLNFVEIKGNTSIVQ